MILRILTFFVFFFLININSAYCQTNKILVKDHYYDHNSGLRGKDIRFIKEGPDGLIWILTNEGINYFDGYQYKFINYDQKVEELFFDQNNNVWLLPTEFPFFDKKNAGINRGLLGDVQIIDGLTKKFLPVKEYLNWDINNTKLKALNIHNKKLWIQTLEGQIKVYSDRLINHNFKHEPNLENHLIYPSNNKNYWLINRNGQLFLFNDDDGSIKKYKASNGVNRFGFAHKIDKQGNFQYRQINKDQTFIELNAISPEFVTSTLHTITDLKDQNITFRNRKNIFKHYEIKDSIQVLYSDGIVKIEYNNKNIVGDLIKDISNRHGLNCISKDSYNNLWLGTYEGIFVLKIFANPFQLYLNEDDKTYSCRGISMDEYGQVLINTYNGIVLLENLETGKVKSILKDYKRNIDLKKINGNEFISGDYSLDYKIIKTSKNPHNPIEVVKKKKSGEYVHSFVMEIEKNVFLCSAPINTFVYDFNKNNAYKPSWLEKSPLSFKYSYSGTESNGVNYIATEGGLFEISKSKSHSYQIRHLLENYSLRQIYIDHENIFWLASTEGLLKYNPQNGDLKKIGLEDGLSHPVLHTVIPDELGNLWLASNNGLNCFNIEKETIKVFFEGDGLSNNEFNHSSFYVTKDGRILLGGIDGMVAFQPKDLLKYKRNEINLKIREILNLDLKSGEFKDYYAQYIDKETLDLFPGKSRYSLTYSLGDFFNAKNNFYATRIEGYEKDWTISKTNNYSLGSLPYGSFKLQIKGKGSGNVWSEIFEIPIEVHRPIYLKWWFIFLLGCLITYLIWLFFRIRLKRLANEKVRLQKTVADKTAELKEKNDQLQISNNTKARLLAIIGHDLRSPALALRGLTKKVNYLIKKERFNDLLKLGENLEENLNGFEKLITNLLNWAVLQQKGLKNSPTKHCVNELITDIIEVYTSLLDSKEMNVEINTPKDLFIFADKNMSSTILRNIIDNAIKYSPNKSLIEIFAHKSEPYVVVSIKDEGKGMTNEIKDQLNQKELNIGLEKNGTQIGLNLTKQLLEVSKGRLEFRNNLEKGTTVDVYLPMNDDKAH